MSKKVWLLVEPGCKTRQTLNRTQMLNNTDLRTLLSASHTCLKPRSNGGAFQSVVSKLWNAPSAAFTVCLVSNFVILQSSLSQNLSARQDKTVFLLFFSHCVFFMVKDSVLY